MTQGMGAALLFTTGRAFVNARFTGAKTVNFALRSSNGLTRPAVTTAVVSVETYQRKKRAKSPALNESCGCNSEGAYDGPALNTDTCTWPNNNKP